MVCISDDGRLLHQRSGVGKKKVALTSEFFVNSRFLNKYNFKNGKSPKPSSLAAVFDKDVEHHFLPSQSAVSQ